MEFKCIGKIHKGQDGVAWGGFLFRFDADGACYVYDLKQNDDEWALFSRFQLGGSESIIPHSNSVTFSRDYYCETDEFPLLFTNVYNNYAGQENRREGVCCVYRLRRQDNEFTADLLATIEVDFVRDSKLWASPNGEDIRPYGNFAVDRENGKLYAFTMRDEFQTTRYFCFALPEITADVNRVTLTKKDVEYFFDCPYHHFVQGACVNDGKIYSLEGFTDNPENPPALRIISLKDRKQEMCIHLEDYGLSIEPELIDFVGDTCYYCGHSGNVYTIDFKGDTR